MELAIRQMDSDILFKICNLNLKKFRTRNSRRHTTMKIQENNKSLKKLDMRRIQEEATTLKIIGKVENKEWMRL